MFIGGIVRSLEHAKVFGTDERRRPMRGALSVWRRGSEGSVASRAIGEGRVCATDHKLSGLRVADDDGIVMTAGRKVVSIVFHDRCRFSAVED